MQRFFLINSNNINQGFDKKRFISMFFKDSDSLELFKFKIRHG